MPQTKYHGVLDFYFRCFSSSFCLWSLLELSTVSSKSPLHVKVIFYELKYFMNFICKNFVFNILQYFNDKQMWQPISALQDTDLW